MMIWVIHAFHFSVYWTLRLVSCLTARVLLSRIASVMYIWYGLPYTNFWQGVLRVMVMVWFVKVYK